MDAHFEAVQSLHLELISQNLVRLCMQLHSTKASLSSLLKSKGGLTGCLGGAFVAGENH